MDKFQPLDQNVRERTPTGNTYIKINSSCTQFFLISSRRFIDLTSKKPLKSVLILEGNHIILMKIGSLEKCGKIWVFLYNSGHSVICLLMEVANRLLNCS